METRKLGGNLSVSAMGLGYMSMTSYYNPPDEAESLKTISRALDLGVTLFDTADMYGPYTNEELVGKGLGARRSDVVLATKFGIIIDPNDNTKRTFNATPEHARQSCEASLKRLGTDYIDLYYLHRIDGQTPIEDTMAELSKLVEEGKVRYVGLSEAGPETIRRAHAVHPITAVQSEYSMFARDLEDAVLPVLRELGIGLVPYSPLGRGLLSGTIQGKSSLGEKDFRHSIPRFAEGNLEKNLELVDSLGKMAAEKSCTTPQLALAWVLAQGNDVVPIPGTTKIKNLETNVAALDVKLTKEESDQIEEIFPVSAVQGNRAGDMSTTNRESI